jgi:hypothetical protein
MKITANSPKKDITKLCRNLIMSSINLKDYENPVIGEVPPEAVPTDIIFPVSSGVCYTTLRTYWHQSDAGLYARFLFKLRVHDKSGVELILRAPPIDGWENTSLFYSANDFIVTVAIGDDAENVIKIWKVVTVELSASTDMPGDRFKYPQISVSFPHVGCNLYKEFHIGDE